MPAAYANYTYRHSPKTRRERRQSPIHRRTVRTRIAKDADTEQMLRLRREREEQEAILLKLAGAERGLGIIEQTAQREYFVTGDNVALRLNDLGLRNLENGNLAKAFRNFKQAIDRDPDLSLAHNNIGLLYLEIGEHQRAQQHFDRAIELDDELDVAYSNRGLLWIELGEYKNAYDDLEFAIDLDPEDPMHHNN